MKELGDWKFWAAVIVVFIGFMWLLNYTDKDGKKILAPVDDFINHKK